MKSGQIVDLAALELERKKAEKETEEAIGNQYRAMADYKSHYFTTTRLP
jgi:hypothetical protein